MKDKRRNYKLSEGKSRSELIASFKASMQAPYWMLTMTQEERDAAAKSGAAMPDGSYPITTCDGENSVDTAVNAVGRSGADHDTIRKHIMTRANSLGCPADMIPDNWNADGSLQDDGSASSSAATRFADAPVKPISGGDDMSGVTSDTVDEEMTQAIAALEAALKSAQDVQAKDPDDNTDPNDAKVDAALTQIATDLAALKEAQTVDGNGDADSQTSDTPADPVVGDDAGPKDGQILPTKLAVINTNPVINPIDDEGNVDPNAVCAQDGCSHLASGHQDLETGDNSGPCQMANCGCGAFMAATGIPGDNSGTDAGPDDGGGPDNAGGDDTAPSSLAAKSFADAAPAAVAPAPEANAAPFVPGGENIGPAFTMPVAVIEGQPTGDGRAIALNALTWGNPPYALMGLSTSTHDPMGYDPNDPAVIIGRIDS